MNEATQTQKKAKISVFELYIWRQIDFEITKIASCNLAKMRGVLN
jgi:hypothetical protein